MTGNYYDILGVPETASKDEIKGAYRKLAMKWHPDKNLGNTEAETRFKEIGLAYETLMDDDKRAEYDAARRGPKPGAGNPFRTGFGTGDIDDIIAQMFGNHGFSFRRGPERNRDVSLTLSINLEDAYLGKQVPLQITTPSGRRIDLIVTIPAGVDNGVRIRYQGQGDHANTSMPPGDLYINISIADHPRFKRNGTSIETTSSVDAISAMIGGRVEVTCIDGQRININVPPGTQPGTRLRVTGKGMPVHAGSNDRGDMIVELLVTIPTNIPKDICDMLGSLKDRIDTKSYQTQ